MFRFTIRDVLWAFLAVALVIGWMVHIRSEREKNDVLWEQRLQLLEQRLQQADSLTSELKALADRQAAQMQKQSPDEN